MKKNIAWFLGIVSLLVFSSCSEPLEHEHSFIDEIIQPTYDSTGYTIHTCSDCGYSYKDSETAKLEHSYSKDWSFNDDSHWNACVDLGYESLYQNKDAHSFNSIVTEPTYDSDGYTTHTCSVCGYSYTDNPTAKKVHNYSRDWTYDQSTHWHACTDSGYQYLKNNEANHTFVDTIKNPTFESDGYTTHTCSVCGYYFIDSYTNTLRHSYSSDYSFNETNHWHACTDEGYESLKKSEAKHTFKNVITRPTFEEEGYTTHTCSVCGYSYVDSKTAKLEHNYDYDWSFDDNYHWYRCIDSGYEDLYKDYSEHNFISEVIPNSEEVEGHTLHTCECGYFYRDHFQCNPNRFIYTLNSEKTEYGVYGYRGEATDLIVPETFNSLPVTSIGSKGFLNNKKIKSIVLPNSIKSIGSSAFSGCSSLESISLSKNLTDILENTFLNCESLKIIEFPDNLQNINGNALLGCSSLEEIKFGKNIASLPNGVLSDCNSLKKLTIPFIGSNNASTSYLGYLFGASSYSLNSDYVPETLETLNLTNLDVVFPNSFYNCSYIKEIVINDGIVSVGNSAFENCSSIKSIKIPDTVELMGKDCLKGCSSLESIEIPFVGKDTNQTEFSEDTLFGYIFGYYYYENSYLVTIGNLPYYFPQNLKNVSINRGNIFQQAFYLCKFIETVSIEKECEIIGDKAFYGCSSMTSIELPSGLLTIGEWTFMGCSSLVEIDIPNTVNYIGWRAFERCESLTSFAFPNSITEIKNSVLCSCFNLKSVYIPYGVTSIDNYAFASCTSLETIIIPDTVKSIGNCTFEHCHQVETLNFKNVAEIPYGAFGFCSLLIDYDFSKVISIDGYAFRRCTSLKKVIFGEETISIGESAFEECTGLEEVIFSSSLKEIGKRAFYGCESLKSISIPNNVLTIGEECFCNCNSATSIQLSNSLSKISGGSFRNCIAIESISIPDNVRTIENSAFSSCLNLKSIYFGKSLQRIESRAFIACQKLTSVVIPQSVTEISKDAFDFCDSSLKLFYCGSPSNLTFLEDEPYSFFGTYYYYSENEPLDADYNYWHYVNGEPTIWAV